MCDGQARILAGRAIYSRRDFWTEQEVVGPFTAEEISGLSGTLVFTYFFQIRRSLTTRIYLP